jgi:hypothetical protein
MNLFQLFFKPQPKFPVPPIFADQCTQEDYNKTLTKRSKTLFKRDKKKKMPWVSTSSAAIYRAKMHEAFSNAGLNDPYTGDKIGYNLIGKWDPNLAYFGKDKYLKQFATLPSVDHKDPNSQTLEFEICTWQVNQCKSDFNPEEFIVFCNKVLQNNTFTKNNNTKTI